MKNMWPYFFINVLIFSCPSIALAPAAFPKDRIVSVEELYRKWRDVRQKKSGAVLLDVRTVEEFRSGHLPGARNISSERPELMLKAFPDRETEIWVYCRIGRRALEVASHLYRHGYRNIYSVDGGVPDWKEKGYPLSPG